LKKLNEITHPHILNYFQNEISNFREDKGTSALILDVALLIETGFYRIVDEVWLVAVSKEVQLTRLIERDGISREQALQRINSQMSLASMLI